MLTWKVGGYASPQTNTDDKILCDFRQGKG